MLFANKAASAYFIIKLYCELFRVILHHSNMYLNFLTQTYPTDTTATAAEATHANIYQVMSDFTHINENNPDGTRNTNKKRKT